MQLLHGLRGPEVVLLVVAFAGVVTALLAGLLWLLSQIHYVRPVDPEYDRIVRGRR